MAKGRKINVGIEFLKDNGKTKHFNITYKGFNGELIVWPEHMNINMMWEDLEDGLFWALINQTGDDLEWAFKFQDKFLSYFK
jgi:hypothetical protein